MTSAFIVVHSDPSDIAGATTIVDADLCLIEHLTAMYPDTFGDVQTDIYRGEIEGDPLTIDEMDFIVGGDETIHICHRPSGLEAATLAYIAIAVSVVAAVAFAPDAPAIEKAGQTKTSGNNNINAQTNLARLYEAVPENFGTNTIYPDIIGVASYQYEGNQKRVRETFCIGSGKFDIAKVTNNETPLDDIEDSVYTVTEDGGHPSDLKAYFQSDQLDNTELYAPDDPSLVENVNLSFFDGGGVYSIQFVDDPDIIERFGYVVGATIIIDGGINAGTYTITDVVQVLGNIAVAEVVTPQFTTLYDAYRANYDPSDGVATGWATLPNISDEIRVNITMPQGVRDGVGSLADVLYDIDIERTLQDGTPTGDTYTRSNSFIGSSQQGRFRTERITINLPSAPNYYRVRCKRNTNKYTATGSVDTLILESVASLNSYSSENFGDVTIIDMVTKAQSTSANQRKLGVTCTRKVESIDVGGAVNPALAASDRFDDAVVHQLITRGSVPESNVDTVELKAIADSLSADLSNISITFDDKDESLGSRVSALCNVARVRAYRDGQTYRFTREESKPIRSALFNRRNIAFDSVQQQTLKGSSDNTFDTVSVRYTNPSTNKPATATCWIDAANGQFRLNEYGSRVKKIEFDGCRNAAQAQDRLILEAKRIVYQRRSVSETVLNDGNLVDVGDRVGWVDLYDNDSVKVDGEIKEVAYVGGSLKEVFLTISEEYDPALFGAGDDAPVMFITDSDGLSKGPYSITADTGDLNVVYLLDANDFDIITADYDNIQAGSRFTIVKTGNVKEIDFSVTGKTVNEDYTVTLELAQYDERMLDATNVVTAVTSAIQLRWEIE